MHLVTAVSCLPLAFVTILIQYLSGEKMTAKECLGALVFVAVMAAMFAYGWSTPGDY